MTNHSTSLSSFTDTKLSYQRRQQATGRSIRDGAHGLSGRVFGGRRRRTAAFAAAVFRAPLLNISSPS